MQSKSSSLIESLTNVLIGMVLAFAISQTAHVYSDQIRQYIWSGFEWQLSASSNVIMTMLLTIVSVIRSYSVRRFFNNKS